jgi:hypothetical protein
MNYNNQAGGGWAWSLAPSGTAGTTATFTQAMTLDASGNLGVGTTSPSGKLEVWGQTRIASSGSSAVLLIDSDATSTNGVNIQASYYGGAGYGPMKFSTGGSERARIDSSGNLLVGGTSASVSGAKLQVINANAAVYRTDGSRPLLTLQSTVPAAQTWNTQLKCDASQNWYMISNPSETVGVYMTPSASGWNNLSDERAKKDWVELSGAIEKVSTLRAGTFGWVKDETLPRDVGLIAQDILAVLPEAVDTSDPENFGVRYTHVVPLLIKAIQEQQAIIQAQAADIAALKAKVGI